MHLLGQQLKNLLVATKFDFDETSEHCEKEECICFLVVKKSLLCCIIMS